MVWYDSYIYHELGVHLNTKSGDPRGHHFLFQRIAGAIQRGNAAAVLGSSSANDGHVVIVYIYIYIYIYQLLLAT